MDRNIPKPGKVKVVEPSLSARRAWIEILSRDADGAYLVVALRKESVDRNGRCLYLVLSNAKSLSARRAWIEITSRWRVSGCSLSLSARRAWIEIKYVVKDSDFAGVALRKESVDRNAPGR